MLCIGIQENSQQIARLLCPALLRNGVELIYCSDDIIDIPKSSSGKAVAIISGELLGNIKSQFDIFVIGDGKVKPQANIKASVVISPETIDTDIINSLSPKSVISYGICSKNTVTVSSLIETSLVVSIQRELVSLSGKRIEEQEIAIELEDAADLDSVLACIAVLFLLDIEVESCEKI